MKKQLLLSLLFAFSIGQIFAQTSPTSTSQPSPEVQLILQLERDLVKAYNTGDTKVLERVLADDVEIDSHITKSLMLEYKKPFDVDGVEVKELNARVWGNTAVATGILALTTKKEVKADTTYQRFIDTFVNRHNKWQLVASQTKNTPVWQVRRLTNNEMTPLTALSCDQESSFRSREGEAEAYIRFSNRSSQPVTIYWINGQGKRDPRPAFISTLNAGKSSGMNTYLTHTFVVTDASGKCLGIYTANKEPGLVIIK